MRRRDIITLLGGAAASCSLVARAQQQSALPVVGFLNGASPDGFTSEVAAFRQGLREADYVEGQNVAIEFRWAQFQYDRLPALAADLVRRQVAVIVATGATAEAVKTATSTIPIVFLSPEPIDSGLVARLNRPGGNLTGISLFAVTLVSKQLELLHEAVPKAAVIGVFVDSKSSVLDAQTREVERAGRALGLTVHIVQTDSNDRNFDQAFATLRQKSVDALLVTTSFAFFGQRDELIAAAARHAMPAMYFRREFVPAGGLISYGASVPDAYRQVGLYTGRILKGAKPADLPVMQPTKFDLSVNLRTAKALGLTISESFLLRADEVIE